MRKTLGIAVMGFAALALCLTPTVRAADVEDLVKKLKDRDPEVRRAAAVELFNAGQAAKSAAPALIAALKDNDAFVRRYSIQALGVVGAEPATVIPALVAAMTDGKERKDAQIAAVVALTKIGPDAVQALASSMRDANLDSSVRQKILEALGNFGEKGRPAVTPLVDEFTGRNMPKGRAPLEQQERMELLSVLEKVITGEDKAHLPRLSDEFASRNLPKGRGQISREEKLGLLPIFIKIANAEDKAVISALETVTNDEKIKDDDQFKKQAKDALQKIMNKK